MIAYHNAKSSSLIEGDDGRQRCLTGKQRWPPGEAGIRKGASPIL